MGFPEGVNTLAGTTALDYLGSIIATHDENFSSVVCLWSKFLAAEIVFAFLGFKLRVSRGWSKSRGSSSSHAPIEKTMSSTEDSEARTRGSAVAYMALLYER